MLKYRTYSFLTGAAARQPLFFAFLALIKKYAETKRNFGYFIG